MQAPNEPHAHSEGEVMSTNNTKHEHKGDEEEEQPNLKPQEPRLSEKDRTIARLKRFKAEGLVFSSYDGISEPEYSVFDTRGGLKQSGTFGRG